MGATFSLDQRQAQKLDVGVRYRPQLGKVLNLGYRFTQDYLEQLDVSAQWPLSRRLSGVARWNYSLQDNSLLEALVGRHRETDHECASPNGWEPRPR